MALLKMAQATSDPNVAAGLVEAAAELKEQQANFRRRLARRLLTDTTEVDVANGRIVINPRTAKGAQERTRITQNRRIRRRQRPVKGKEQPKNAAAYRPPRRDEARR